MNSTEINILMQTLKLKYRTTESNINIIREYQRQYSHLLRCAYNRAKEKCVDKYIETNIKSLNNLPLMESFFTRSATKEAIQMAHATDNKVIFGGRKNFIDRCQNKITKEEFRNRRLSPIYSLGEANQKGNRKFQISQDGGSILFKPCKSTHIVLEIIGTYKQYRKLLSKLYNFQEAKSLPISYKLDSEYVYVTFDEKEVSNVKPIKSVNNRIFAIDLNPNYVGWSVVDWKSSSSFNVIDSGVISIKKLNDKEFALKKTKNNPNGYSSEHPERIYLNNKRVHEIYEISKHLVNIALHYRCSTFVVEDLSIKSSDKCKGKSFNSLCNKMWNRNKMVENIQKRCNIYGLSFQKVQPNYSSFIGNFLFRGLNLPDMILASIEIGRRGYEFSEQYIKKTKDIKKNIIQPLVEDFVDRCAKSLEEFGLSVDFKDMIEVYYFLKNSKCRYRVSLDSLNPEFFSLFSKASLILKINKF